MDTLLKILILVGVAVVIKIFVWPLLENLWYGILDVFSIILPYIIGGVIVVGKLFINWMVSDSVGGFIGLLFQDLLIVGGCVFFYWLLESKKAENIRFLICFIAAGGYLLYTLIKNIIVSEGFGDFILNEIASIATPIIIFIILKKIWESGPTGYEKSLLDIFNSPEKASFLDPTCASCKYYDESLRSCTRGNHVSIGSEHQTVCGNYQHK